MLSKEDVEVLFSYSDKPAPEKPTPPPPEEPPHKNTGCGVMLLAIAIIVVLCYVI